MSSMSRTLLWFCGKADFQLRISINTQILRKTDFKEKAFLRYIWTENDDLDEHVALWMQVVKLSLLKAYLQYNECLHRAKQTLS